MGNCMAALLGLAVVLTIVFYAAAPQLLVWFGASEATLPYALEYTRIYVLGSVFVLLVMGMNPFVTTQGFAKFSMMTTVIGAVCNIVLDPILIFGFKMGLPAPPSQPFSARASAPSGFFGFCAASVPSSSSGGVIFGWNLALSFPVWPWAFLRL